ncbi:MAG: hypothetical protein E7158_01260 [Firmicutes bacterium]|nr:hypothetical protein [Bacillota bacterium]
MSIIDKFVGKNLKKDEKAFNKIRVYEIVLSILFIIVGVVIFMNKMISDNAVANVLGILIILEAIINIYSAVMPNSNSLYKSNLIFGILYIIVAIFMFTNIIKFINYLPIYYGVYIIINGLKTLLLSVNLLRIKDESFLVILVMSLLIIAVGNLLLFYPFGSFSSLELVAVFSILIGIINASYSNLLKKRAKKIISKVDSE